MAQLLKTLDPETKQAPKSRIGTAENATQFVFRLIQGDDLRAQLRTKIKGNVDGNAPYSKAELTAKGMPETCNLNFRQGAAIINQYKTPYYDLLVEVPLLASIRTAFGTSTEIGDWSQIISEEYHRAVTTWEDWDFVSQYHQFQMLLHGVGVCFFRDAVDWRPDVARTGEMLVQDNARSKVSELDSLVLLKSYSAPDMYRYIRNPEIARELGWNVPAVEQAIIEARFGGGPYPGDANPWEWYQEKFKNADLYYGTYDCEAVRTGSLLIKEFDGRVSHHIVRSDRVSDKFLYSHIGRFNSMSEVVVPFFYDIGDGTWHSINGLGKDIYAYCEMFNRLRGREVDGAMIAASVVLQSKDASTITKSQLVTFANLSILPPNLELMPSNIGQGIEATAVVRRDMQQTLNENIGLIGRVPGTIDPRKGQKQALAEMQQAAQLGKGNINRYYTALDKLHKIMYSRLSNLNIKSQQPGATEALEFQRRCKMRGVPVEALAQLDSINAMRSIGAGSAVNAMEIASAILEHANSYPEEGREVAIRLWLSRLAGTYTANSIMGPTQTSRATEDDSIAALENNALRTGGQVIITMQQSHVRHLEIHEGDMEAHIQEVQDQAAQQGMDMNALQSLLLHLDTGGKHCLEHLSAIQNDPIRAEDFKILYKRWQALAKITDQVQQQLDEMMQAQQQQQPQGQSTEEFLKLLNYKSAPESIKAQMEAAAGLARQEGDISVDGQNLSIKEQQAQLKAAKQQEASAHANVKLGLTVQDQRFYQGQDAAKLAMDAAKLAKEPASV